MATNDFLPFAGGAGANVLTQADYAALAALATGFGSGILPSDKLNKVLRQGTTMAAVLGKFIADGSGDDVHDNGDTAAIGASLIKALLGAGGTGASDYITLPFRDKTTGARRNLIAQWMNGAYTNGGTYAFPIAFPTACLALTCMEFNQDGTALNAQIVGYQSFSATGFVASVVPLNTGGSQSNATILAIGY